MHWKREFRTVGWMSCHLCTLYNYQLLKSLFFLMSISTTPQYIIDDLDLLRHFFEEDPISWDTLSRPDEYDKSVDFSMIFFVSNMSSERRTSTWIERESILSKSKITHIRGGNEMDVALYIKIIHSEKQLRWLTKYCNMIWRRSSEKMKLNTYRQFNIHDPRFLFPIKLFWSDQDDHQSVTIRKKWSTPQDCSPNKVILTMNTEYLIRSGMSERDRSRTWSKSDRQLDANDFRLLIDDSVHRDKDQGRWDVSGTRRSFFVINYRLKSAMI